MQHIYESGLKMKLLPYKAIAIAMAFLITACAPSDGTKTIKHVDQTVATYTKNTPEDALLITPQQQDKLKDQYLERYYSVWDNDFSGEILEKYKIKEISLVSKFAQEPGYNDNKQPIKLDWIKKISDKMNMNEYPNTNKKAITLRNMNIRTLPTNKASYRSDKIPGEGYPFDHLQESLIPANTPVYIIHQSHDKSWSYIVSHNSEGWVKTNHLGLVDEKFIATWKSKNYITSTTLGNCIVNPENNKFLFQARFGSILPLVSENKNSYKIHVATLNKKDTFSTIKTVEIKKSVSARWPLIPTHKNVTNTIQTLIGQPYGYGGLFGFRDCSSSVMDIFASYGIWIPRNASQQHLTGKYISFNSLNSKEKAKAIQEQGVPLLTLINLNDHTLLYVGEKYNNLFVFQTVWGMHTGTPFKETGRSIIAKTVITPIDLGSKYINVPKSFLDRAKGMTIVTEL